MEMKKKRRMSRKTEGKVCDDGKEGKMRGGEEKAMTRTRELEQRENDIKGRGDLYDRSHYYVLYNRDGERV